MLDDTDHTAQIKTSYASEINVFIFVISSHICFMLRLGEREKSCMVLSFDQEMNDWGTKNLCLEKIITTFFIQLNYFIECLTQDLFFCFVYIIVCVFVFFFSLLSLFYAYYALRFRFNLKNYLNFYSENVFWGTKSMDFFFFCVKDLFLHFFDGDFFLVTSHWLFLISLVCSWEWFF